MTDRSGRSRSVVPVAGRRVRRPRIGRRTLLIVGLLIAAAAMAATVGMLRVYPLPNPAPGSDRDDVSVRIMAPTLLVYANDASRRYLAGTGGDLHRVTGIWIDWFSSRGISVRATEEIGEWTDEVLVLPHVYCLSDRERSWIARRVEEGSGILVCGPCGVRDTTGAWLGWDAMGALIGSTGAREVPRDLSFFMTVGWAAPIGCEEITGRRIAVHPVGQCWGIEGLAPAAFWSDYRRVPIPEPNMPLLSAGIRVLGRGRVAWVGAGPDLGAVDDAGRLLAADVLDGLLSYAGGAPLVGIDRWPEGKRATLVFEIDTEAEFGNARFFDEVLSARSLPGSFFCVSDIAKTEPDLLASLAVRHAIGSHSDDHRRFEGQESELQRERLERTRRDLAALSSRAVIGFRPPEEAYDEATLAGMRAAGFRYLLGNLNDPGVLPHEIQSASSPAGPPLHIVPRVVRDDYEHIVQMERSEEGIVTEMLADLELVHRTGGTALFSFHTHLLGRPDRIGALRSFVDTIDLDDLLVVDSDRLVSWWQMRQGIEAAIERVSDGVYEIQVANRGVEPIEGACLLLQLPGNPAQIDLDDRDLRVIAPDERGSVRLVIDRLPPRSDRTIRISASGPLSAMR